MKAYKTLRNRMEVGDYIDSSGRCPNKGNWINTFAKLLIVGKSNCINYYIIKITSIKPPR